MVTCSSSFMNRSCRSFHIGRTTGRAYRTPLLVLKRGDHYLVGLWYGSDVHWVKNVLAAGGCEMLINGRHIQTFDPEVVTDGVAQLLPPPLALAGRLVHLTEVLRLHPNSIRFDQRTE